MQAHPTLPAQAQGSRPSLRRPARWLVPLLGSAIAAVWLLIGANSASAGHQVCSFDPIAGQQCFPGYHPPPPPPPPPPPDHDPPGNPWDEELDHTPVPPNEPPEQIEEHVTEPPIQIQQQIQQIIQQQIQIQQIQIQQIQIQIQQQIQQQIQIQQIQQIQIISGIIGQIQQQQIQQQIQQQQIQIQQQIQQQQIQIQIIGQIQQQQIQATPPPPPPAPAAPAALPAPSVTLACTTTGVQGDFESWTAGAATGWEREAIYEIQWRHGTAAWQPATVTVTGDDVSFTANADPGNTVDVQIRGHGRQRRDRLGTWSAWSNWGPWSSWDQSTTSTCPVPTPAAPTVPAQSVTLTCGPSQFTGTFTGWANGAPTSWNRQHEYEAQYRRSGTTGAWTAATVTVLPANEVRISGPNDATYAIDVQVRGRGRHRQEINSTWSAWSTWGTWSSWQTSTTPTCPPPPPPPAPSAPTAPAVTCTGTPGDPSNATITWTAVGADGSLVQYQYEVSWYFDIQSGSSSVQRTVTVGPLATLSTAISDGTDFDDPLDLLSIRVRARTRVRALASDPWNPLRHPWSPWSDSSAQPDMTVTSPNVACVTVSAS